MAKLYSIVCVYHSSVDGYRIVFTGIKNKASDVSVTTIKIKQMHKASGKYRHFNVFFSLCFCHIFAPNVEQWQNMEQCNHVRNVLAMPFERLLDLLIYIYHIILKEMMMSIAINDPYLH